MNSATQAVIERQPVGGAAAVDELGIVAAFVRELRFEALPAEVVARARATLMDSLGVMIAGAREARVQAQARLLEARGSRGRSVFVANGRRGDAADAALVNATAACAHVLDEGHKYARGHVATYVLPSVLAVAEEQNASGSEFITAFVAAYEVAARMGMACRVREAMHPSGTWGTIGAAAAVARLMGFDVARIRETMTVAAPLVRSSVFDRVGQFDITLPSLEDWDLRLRCALAGVRFESHVAHDAVLDRFARRFELRLDQRQQMHRRSSKIERGRQDQL